MDTLLAIVALAGWSNRSADPSAVTSRQRASGPPRVGFSDTFDMGELMTDEDIQALLRATPDRSLDDLEAAVWRGVAAREAANRKLMTLSVLQSGALVLVMLISVSWGAMNARSWGESEGLGVFSPRMALAPSTRLIGADG